jgi:hypothetical protein
MTRDPSDRNSPVDDRMLEYLEHRAPVPLQDIQAATEKGCGLRYSRAEAADRLERLLHYRLVSYADTTTGYLSGFGARYLDGERNAGLPGPDGHPHDDESHGQLIK